jgi:ribosomal protein L37E
MNCKRCGQSMVLYEVNDRYCLLCKREVAARERADAKRQQQVIRFTAKDFTRPLGAA